MNQPCYFLSYARLDAEDKYATIPKFYEDLDAEVCQLKNIKHGEAGFFDRKNLQQGSNWPTELVEALSTCRTLICLYSPAYFGSDYCGREWQIFTSRFSQAGREFASAPGQPNLILPVLLRPPSDFDLPPGLAHIQYDDDAYPDEYRENGLHTLMKLTGKKDDYHKFIVALARKIVKAAKHSPALPDLDPRPDIKTVKSAFHPEPEPSPAVAGKSTAPALPTTFGPKYAEFVYVAASRDEASSITPIAPRLEYYGDEGLAWKPYWPEETRMGIFAEFVANREGFKYNKIPLEKDLVRQIKGAHANEKIVVVVVDTWTLFLDKYYQVMKDYDDASFENSLVLVVWNDNDPKVVNHRDALEEQLQKTFPSKTIIRDERYFVDNISSASDLQNRLGVALQTVLAQIINNSKTRFKKIPNAQSITKPEIPGPGGTTV